jgi:hypothetical protein
MTSLGIMSCCRNMAFSKTSAALLLTRSAAVLRSSWSLLGSAGLVKPSKGRNRSRRANKIGRIQSAANRKRTVIRLPSAGGALRRWRNKEDPSTDVGIEQASVDSTSVVQCQWKPPTCARSAGEVPSRSPLPGTDEPSIQHRPKMWACSWCARACLLAA